jgi:hypothetical protein
MKTITDISTEPAAAVGPEALTVSNEEQITTMLLSQVNCVSYRTPAGQRESHGLGEGGTGDICASDTV